MAQLAKDHARFAKLLGSSSWLLRQASPAMASIKGTRSTWRFAKAQALLVKFCCENSDMRDEEKLHRRFSNLLSAMATVEKPQTKLARL